MKESEGGSKKHTAFTRVMEPPKIFEYNLPSIMSEISVFVRTYMQNCVCD